MILALSYGMHKSKQNHTNVTAKNTELEASSMQVSYSMGGATFKLAQTDVDHGLLMTVQLHLIEVELL